MYTTFGTHVSSGVKPFIDALSGVFVLHRQCLTKVIIAGKIPQKGKTAATRLMHPAKPSARLVSILQIDGKQGKRKWAARSIGRLHLLFARECAFVCALVRGALKTKEFTARRTHIRTCKAFIFCLIWRPTLRPGQARSFCRALMCHNGNQYSRSRSQRQGEIVSESTLRK
jgi:hypothetical protein